MDDKTMGETVQRLRRLYDDVRPRVEATSPDRELDQDLYGLVIRLSRNADEVFRYALAHGGGVPTLVNEIRDFMRAHDMPGGLKERTGVYIDKQIQRPAQVAAANVQVSAGQVVAREMGEKMDAAIRDHSGITRQRIVQLMRENFADPAGFHEALAGELGIHEEEYEEPKLWRYTLSADVIDAANRVANALVQGRGDVADLADIKLIADAINEGEGEAVDD